MRNKPLKKPTHKRIAKVPFVMQMETLECGAACLTMVLAYYNRWEPLSKVRSDCGVSRNGSNALNIIKAARNYGLTANGYKLDLKGIKEKATFPCIVHWNNNHFIVLRGFRGKKAYISDPGRGECTISIDEFTKCYSGICLMFSPGEFFKTGGKKRSMVSYAKKRLAGAISAFVFVAITTIVTSVVEAVDPMFSQVLIDNLLVDAIEASPEWFIPFMIVFGVFSLVQLIALWVKAIYSYRINGRLAIAGSTSYMWKVFRLPMEFFSQRMAGDIQQRENTNATIAKNIIDIFAPLILQSIMMVFYLFIMIRYNWILSLIGVVSILIDLLMAQIISKKRVNVTRIASRDEARLYSTTISGIESIETIKSSGSEDGFFQKWSSFHADATHQTIKYERINNVLGFIPELIKLLTNNIILILGVCLTIQNKFSVGMIMAFEGLLLSFSQPASEIITASQSLQEMRTEMERIEDVMEYPSDESYDVPFDDAKEFYKLKGNIEIKNLSFGYSKLEEPLIKDFNLSLKTGQKVAFVGSSGCGKSTLARLIGGLYKPWSGEILYDGKSTREIPREIFTGSVSVIDQDIILFNDTIENNIKMWDKSIEDFEMILAAKDAHIHDVIMDRKDGYNHVLLEGGKDFSGGQKQRIEIARALSQDPTILIMDEATSSLDAKTEKEVIKAINDRGITCIIAAHRLSTIRDCDEIIVLDDGVIVERGTHDELFKKNGFYTKLIKSE